MNSKKKSLVFKDNEDNIQKLISEIRAIQFWLSNEERVELWNNIRIGYCFNCGKTNLQDKDCYCSLK